MSVGTDFKVELAMADFEDLVRYLLPKCMKDKPWVKVE